MNNLVTILTVVRYTIITNGEAIQAAVENFFMEVLPVGTIETCYSVRERMKGVQNTTRVAPATHLHAATDHRFNLDAGRCTVTLSLYNDEGEKFWETIRVQLRRRFTDEQVMLSIEEETPENIGKLRLPANLNTPY